MCSFFCFIMGILMETGVVLEDEKTAVTKKCYGRDLEVD